MAEQQEAGGPLLHAVARYQPAGTNGTTEIAILVEDGWQHLTGDGSVICGPILWAALGALLASPARSLRSGCTAIRLAPSMPSCPRKSRIRTRGSPTRKPLTAAAARPLAQ